MRIILSIICMSSILLLTGCQFFQANNTGKGTTFQYGKMEGFINSPLTRAHNATAKAVKSLELNTLSVNKDALISIYKVTNAKDETITITIESVSSKSVKIYIKVGIIGDQMYSQAIFDSIKKFL